MDQKISSLVQDLCENFLQEYPHSNLDELVELPKKIMVHIDQEPKVFNTNKRTKNKTERAHYNEYRQKCLDTSVETYLRNILDGKKRLPGNCVSFARVCGHLTAVAFDSSDVYFIGKTRPLYVKGRMKNELTQTGIHKHSLNAILQEDRFVFFDSSVYKKVYSPSQKKWISLEDAWNERFYESDIRFDTFIKWDRWVQSSPTQRIITPDRISGEYRPSLPNFNPSDYLIRYML